MRRRNSHSKDPLEELTGEVSKKKSSYNIVALIIVFFAAVSLNGTVFYIYNQYQDKPEGEVVVITADENTNEMKFKPLDPGGMVVDNMDKVVYDTIDGNLLSKEEKVQILAPVEEPIDKTSELETFSAEEGDEELVADEEIGKNVAFAAPVIEKKEEVIIEKPEEIKPEIKSEIKPIVKQDKYIEAKQKESSKKITQAVKKNTSFYKIQLASFKSKSAAEKEWSHLSKKLPKHIGGYEKYIVAKDVEGKGIFYRLQIGPFEIKEEASKTCKLIKQSGINCFIVKP